MCLITNQIFAKTAKEDIHVYKVLVSLNKHNPRWVTPYQSFNVQLNNMIIPNGDISKNIKSNWNWYDYSLIKHIILKLFHPTKTFIAIEGGFIHSFHSLHSAKITKSLFKHGAIFEAIIPKGSKYYISDNKIEYCSDKLFITDKQIN